MHVGILGRILLSLMAVLAVTIGIAIALAFYEREHAPALYETPYPRLEQAAGAADLLQVTDPKLRFKILRALNSVHLHAAIAANVPAEAALRRAPRIEAMLRAFSDSRPDEDIRAYTDPGAPQPPNSGTEGRPARIVWRLADGQFLVLDEIEAPRGIVLRVLGLPPGLWIGVLGIAVAILALYTIAQQTRPLRLLASAAAAFNGRPPPAPIETEGTPDVRALAQVLHDMQMRVGTLLQERAFLIGSISHDLKTYLTRLRLRAEGIADKESQLRMIQDIDAMNELIDASLAFARGTTVSEERDRIDLADLVAIEAAERDALDQPIGVAGIDDADAVVAGDLIALRRVIANLVANAIKFGQGRVEISLETGPSEARLHVDDDGPGVKPSDRAAIFSPFYRIESARHRSRGGSGLGLAIARQIVEAHGGTLAVSDGPLGGARFTATLPRFDRTAE